METVPQSLESAARWRPDQPMLNHRGHQLSYRDVNATANRLANTLTDLGVAEATPVALLLPSSPALVFAYYGVLKAGGIAAPLNAMFTPPEVNAMTEYLATSVLITTPELVEPLLRAGTPGLDRILVWDEHGAGVPEGTLDLIARCSAAPDTNPLNHATPDGVATIFHTSGTTGRPKGAAQTHANIMVSGRQMITHTGWRLGAEHVVCPLPLFNNFGSTVVLTMTVMSVATMTIVERWDAEQVLSAFRSGASRMVGTPTMYVYLLAAHDPGEPLRLAPCIVGGQTTPADVRTEFEERFGTRLINLYGATETQAVTLTPLAGPYPAGSVGQPLGQATITVVDDNGIEVGSGVVGELVLGGDTVCAGYWRDAERTAASFVDAGWRSGDLGFRDQDGYIHVVDRKKDLIITGGANIYPAEIEAVLHQHPAVALAAVIGIPDRAKGEIPKAYIVRKPGTHLDHDELTTHLRARLAAYKCPRALEFVDNLPTSPVGKVLKRELRAG